MPVRVSSAVSPVRPLTWRTNSSTGTGCAPLRCVADSGQGSATESGNSMASRLASPLLSWPAKASSTARVRSAASSRDSPERSATARANSFCPMTSTPFDPPTCQSPVPGI